MRLNELKPTDEPVGADQLVLAPGLLDPRHARHDEDLHQQQRRGHQAGQAPERGQCPTEGGELADPATGDPQRGDGEQKAPQGRAGGIAPPP